MINKIRRPLVTIWLGGWLLGAGFGAAFTLSEASEVPPPKPLIARGLDGARLGDIKVRVSSISIMPSQTTVLMMVDGRPDAGPTVNLLERAQLVLGDGTRISERSGSVDGRVLKLVFPSVDIASPLEASITLDLQGVALSRRPPGVARDSDRQFVGRFVIDTSPALRRISTGRVVPYSVTSPFGSGALSIREVVHDETATVVRGTLSGFTAQQIQEMVLDDATLTTPDDVTVRMTFGRSGFGDGLADFEYTFPRTAGVVSFVVSLGLAPTPKGDVTHSAVAETLRSVAGATASARLDLGE